VIGNVDSVAGCARSVLNPPKLLVILEVRLADLWAPCAADNGRRVPMNRLGGRRVRRGLLALAILVSTGIAGSVPAGGQQAPVLVGTGRAAAVAGVVPLLGPVAVSDTGPVASSDFTVTEKSLAFVPLGLLLTVAGAHSVVHTRTTSDGSFAASDVAAAIIGIPGLPVIRLWGVASWSATTCRGSGGVSSVGLLQVGARRINVSTSPNTVIPLGVLTIAINEQRPFTTPDGGKGLTVSAVHIFGLGINLYIASATSDLHGCPTGATDTPPAAARVF
jgi:hypothetical protein